MLSGNIENLVRSSGSELTTELFVLGILAVFFAGLILRMANRLRGFTNYVPTLLTTLGILGTFVGIVAGLLAFDVNNIDGSIAGLLDGMKTAFITSLVGMMTAILFKVLATMGLLDLFHESEVSPEDVGAAELHRTMLMQVKSLELLKRAIGGDNDSSLVGQLKLFRSDVNDHEKGRVQQAMSFKSELWEKLGDLEKLKNAIVSDDENSINGKLKLLLGNMGSWAEEHKARFAKFEEQLWLKLEEFADMMSRSATEQVVDALKQVIQDFNRNLTEQFGQNFAKLNDAVESLVTWQERNKEHLEQMILQYEQGVTAITHTAESVKMVEQESRRIPESMDALREVMTVNQHQIEELNRHLETFGDLRDRAVEAVPEIRSQIDATLEGVKEASNEISSGMQVAGKELQSSIIQGAQDFENASTRVNESLQKSSDVVRTNSEQVAQQFGDLTSDLNGKFRETISEVDQANQNLTSEFKRVGDALVLQIERSKDEFDAGMKSIRQQFGQNLEAMASEQSREMSRLLRGMESAAESALASTGESLSRQVEALDEARSREMNEIAEAMGGALTSITGQFTRDYQQLVQAMRQVTEAGRTA